MNRKRKWQLFGIWIRLFATTMLASACVMWLINVFLVREGSRHVIDWEELCGIIGLVVGCMLATVIELRIGDSRVFHYACVFATIAGMAVVIAQAFASPSAGLGGYLSDMLAMTIVFVGCIVAALSLVLAIVMALIRDRPKPYDAPETIAWAKMLLTHFLGILVLVACGVAFVAIGVDWPNANALVRQAEENDVVGMRRSLFLGVDPNEFQLRGWHDGEGETPLTAAARAGSADAVHLLLDRGADPNLRNSGGEDYSHDTPLSVAAYHGHLEICRILIDSGAATDTITYPNQSPKSGGRWTALDWAIFNGQDEVADYLQDVGASESGLRSQAMIDRQDSDGQ